MRKAGTDGASSPGDQSAKAETNSAMDKKLKNRYYNSTIRNSSFRDCYNYYYPTK